MSTKSAIEIVTIKGCFSGLGSLTIALILGERLPGWKLVCGVLALGFVAYGLSITFYIRAQKELGAAKTSVYYSIAPFIGVAFSMLLLGERPGLRFYLALAIMALSTVILINDTIALQHTHPHTHSHTHEHWHDGLIHTHEHTHTHTHNHVHTADEELHLHPHKELPNHQHSHPSDNPGIIPV